MERQPLDITSEKNSKLSLILKVTSECNLSCKYCHYLGKGDENLDTQKLDVNILKQAIASLLSLGPREVEFIWHGGEPLLRNIEFYSEAVRIQRASCEPNQKITNSIQTNATLLDTTWVEFFRQEEFHVGVSIDGPEELHNAQRVTRSSDGSFQDVMQGIELLRNANISFGALVVVTKNSLAYQDDIFRFFVDHGILNFDFLPHAEIVSGTNKWHPLSVTVSEFTDFMLKIMKLWLREDNPNVHIRKLEDLLGALLGASPSTCIFSGNCYRYLTIQPNGDIYPCDHFVGEKNLRIGNLSDSSLYSMLHGEKYQEFGRLVLQSPAECQICPWHSICNAGCSYRRYMIGRDFDMLPYFCNTWKTLLKRLSGYVENVVGEVPYLSKKSI
jgi:uncharacterized protein